MATTLHGSDAQDFEDGPDDELESNADLEDKLDDALDPDRSSLYVGAMLSESTTAGWEAILGEKLSAQPRRVLEAMIEAAESRRDNAALTGPERSEVNLDLEILNEALAKLPAEDEPSTESKTIDLMAALKDSLSGSGASPSHEKQKPEPAVASSISLGELREIAVNDIAPDPDQPREAVDDELWASIAANGVLQPIVVRPHPKAGEQIPGINMRVQPFMLVDGERRWRGARKADLATVPARVMLAADDDGDRLLHQVVFNDGKRLTPMEEARSWKRIMTAKGWTAQQLAKALGRGKSTVSDRLALLDAPAPFRKYFESGLLTAAAAPIVRPLLDLPARALERVADAVHDDWNFERAEDDFQSNGKAMRVDAFQKVIDQALNDELAPIDPALEVEYKGKEVQIGSQRYAIDADAYHKAAEKAKSGLPKPKPKPKPPTAAEAKALEAQKKLRAKHNADNAKAKADQERKELLYREQFRAVAAKVPGAIDGEMALVLIRVIAESMFFDNDGLEAIGIASVATSGCHAPHGLVKYAGKLDGKARVQLLIKLAIYAERPPYRAENDYVAFAAKALNVDLKKVKLPTAEKPAVAATPAKKLPAKPATKKRR